jgi:hypothetical protein
MCVSVYTIEVHGLGTREPATHQPENLYVFVYNSNKLTTQMYRQMLIIRIMEYPQPGRTVPNQKGGQNANVLSVLVYFHVILLWLLQKIMFFMLLCLEIY